MANQWFYRRYGRELGPFSPDEMRHFAALGRISTDTLVRKGEQGIWVNASQVKGLLSESENCPTLRPSPSPSPVLPKRQDRPGPEQHPVAVAVHARQSPASRARMLPAVGVATLTICVLAGGAVFMIARWGSNPPDALPKPTNAANSSTAVTPEPVSVQQPVPVPQLVDPTKEAVSAFPAFAESVVDGLKAVVGEEERTVFLPGNHEFRYVLRVSNKYTIDVKKTDSILTPIVGEIKVSIESTMTYMREVGKTNKPLPTVERVIGANFREGRWQLDKELSVVLDNDK